MRLFLFALALVIAAPRATAEVQIERTFLPHGAAPSSFAISLPGGVNVCFDPVRGAVSYVWTGGFLDLAPARPGPGKFIEPARLLGPVVYRETGEAPLRRGEALRAPTVEFAGYALRDDHVEFRYTIDGTLVREEVRVRSDGAALVRRFHLATGSDARWWYVVDGQPPHELARVAGQPGVLQLEIPLAPPAR